MAETPKTTARRVRPSRRRGGRVALLPQLLAAAVELNPSGVAVSCAGREVSYTELDEWSSRLARVLIGRGVGPEDLVAVGIPRSVESVVAVWAVAKAGAGFVPVDPQYPAARVEYMVTDSGVVLGVTVSQVRELLPDAVAWLDIDDAALVDGVSGEGVSYADRVRALRAEHPAYVIYTSGSTGKPKGVVVTHAGLAGFCAEQRDRYGVSAGSRTLHFASPSFDASVLELLLAVGAGATMVVAPAGVFGGQDLAGLLRSQQVTHAFVTPAALASVDPSGLDELRVVVAGGEACPPELVNRWAVPLADGSRRRFHNGYGPTETTIMCNISAALNPDDLVVIGPAIRGMSAWILDGRLKPVPTGVAGELYVAGPGLARGYHARAGLTAQRFVANPFDDGGARLYRTGDVARWTPDGAVEYLGRNDFQVKVRGFRIELGEIDAVLSAHPRVDFAVTVGKTTPAGETVLVAYVMGSGVETGELLDYAAQSLPPHMVPTLVTVIDEVPLTPVGKLDRAALPEPQFAAREYRAPSGPVEEAVAAVFADVLDIGRVGRDDDFFDLGGNSLIATQVAARLSATLDARIPARIVFEASTVRELAAAVTSRRGEGARPPLSPHSRPERIPLSLAQQRMWFLNRFEPNSAAYNVPMAVRLSGTLDVDALRAAVADVVARHETLRTVYPETDDGPVQRVLPAAAATPDLVVVPVAVDGIGEQMFTLATAPFDVTTGVPIRLRLFETAPKEHVLAVVVHHISTDGSSIAPLTRDLMTAYSARAQGQPPMWAPLRVQYADYALWQRELLGSESDPDSLASQQLAYWKQALADLPEQLDLPADRPRPPVQSFAGAKVGVEIDRELHRSLVAVARSRHATLFMVVETALAVFLARMSGTDDIAIGTPIAGRGEPELDDLIGMFVNTLVFRTRIPDGGRSFASLLDEGREEDLGAFANADIPFERLVEVLNPQRSTARHPLFQVGLSFQNLAAPTLELPGLTVRAFDVDTAVAQFDLHLIVADQYDEHDAPLGMTGFFTYATDLFDEVTVQGFVDGFLRVLRAVTADPGIAVGDVELVDSPERQRILTASKGATHPVDPSTTLVSLFEEQVRATPAAVALVDDGAELTFAAFDERVNRLARRLITAGVGPETLVGLAMRRSVDLVTAMFAVAKAGGAYVPLDPDHPAERIAYILDTARPATVLTRTRDDIAVGSFDTLAIDTLDLSDFDASAVRDTERTAPLHAAHPAYVIFTSGSTGRPKGVTVSHAAIANQLLWKRSYFGLGAGDAVLLKTAATFDLSVWEFWSALVSGARLVIASRDGHQDPAYLNLLIDTESVTTLHVVPSMLDALLTESGGTLASSLRRVVAIGEALPPVTAQRFRAGNDATLHNLYGPTEAAVSVTAHVVTADDRRSVPIGVPEWNTGAYVLDRRLHPVPVGVEGELYLSGAQLARGYHARPDLTSDRFVADPFGAAGTRMYRTGDRVAWTRSGEMDYRGRTDFQVKVRGFRIELGEIEAALRNNAAIDDVAVICRTDRHGDEIIAYLVPAPGRTVDTAATKIALSRQLPNYMVPSAFLELAALPRTVNGKLDRAALPERQFAVHEYREPSGPVEKAVAEVFAAVLGIERVGLDDDFFSLGGNSMLAAQATSRLRRELGTPVQVQWLFGGATVADLAARLVLPSSAAAGDPDAGFGVLLPIRTDGSLVPIHCVHPVTGLAWPFLALAPYLDRDRPVYGLQYPVLESDDDIDTVEALALRYIRAIRTVQPVGPYRLAGWSAGGVIAHAMAVRLQAEGETVLPLIMFDATSNVDDDLVRGEIASALADLGVELDPSTESGLTGDQAAELLGALDAPEGVTVQHVQRFVAGALKTAQLIAAYRPDRFDGDLEFFSAEEQHPRPEDAAWTWQPFVSGVIRNLSVPVSHGAMMSAESLATIGPVLDERLATDTSG